MRSLAIFAVVFVAAFVVLRCVRFSGGRGPL